MHCKADIPALWEKMARCYCCMQCHLNFQTVFWSCIHYGVLDMCVCVCCLLMVSPGSESCLFSIAVFFFFFAVPWTAANHSVCEAKKREKKGGDHLMCVWLCLIKLLEGEEWWGSNHERVNLEKQRCPSYKTHPLHKLSVTLIVWDQNLE